MKDNPFTSDTFKEVWKSFFAKDQSTFTFSSIDPIEFVKNKKKRYFFNVGNNLTGGLNYNYSEDKNTELKNKVLLIRDVSDFLENSSNRTISSSVKREKIYQYQGYLSNLSDFEDLDSYMRTKFKSNTRSKFRRNLNRLEACFDTEYKFYHGEISRV